MCGRYRLKTPPSEVAILFDVDVRDNFPPRYNVAPTQPIAIIRQNERRQREYALARWGFIPEWAKKDYLDRMGGRPLINARAETAHEKPTFKNAFKRRRCLIPADGFYEWTKTTDGAKQPFSITQADSGLFAMAGIWETAVDPDGGEMDTVAILTIGAGPDLKSIHAREPVVIAPEHFALWVEGDERDTKAIAQLLAPAREGHWSYHPVSTAVNSPRNDGPELAEPIAA